MTLKRSEPNKNTWQKQMTDGPTKTSARISSLVFFIRQVFYEVSLFLAHFSMSLSKTNDNDERRRNDRVGRACIFDLSRVATPKYATSRNLNKKKDKTDQLFCKVSFCQRHVLVQPEVTPYWRSHFCCFHSILFDFYFSYSLVWCATISSTFWADK